MKEKGEIRFPLLPPLWSLNRCEKISRKVIILSILYILTSTFWTIKSKPLRVMRQMSTFWNQNKYYFHKLKVEHNKKTFILPPPPPY